MKTLVQNKKYTQDLIALHFSQASFVHSLCHCYLEGIQRDLSTSSQIHLLFIPSKCFVRCFVFHYLDHSHQSYFSFCFKLALGIQFIEFIAKMNLQSDYKYYFSKNAFLSTHYLKCYLCIPEVRLSFYLRRLILQLLIAFTMLQVILQPLLISL